ncbi:Protein SAV [Galdieria sulphuraria]|uniref:AAA-type ATPase n=1 Tax=Galdieria sulphuraria TaxID=130081 RepID=M2VS63_GALSU|nr:AAA-type ATPase [Galdieria sulphuraria]EME25951.1 AAA-type ATPase [Galdieria sulphuraria]GJD10038.1 Protein SAV [Galdieria sulphuraria]|eukprot:XP_005702471.1 AAA-type ATPase [Galdieria sulphuraria]
MKEPCTDDLSTIAKATVWTLIPVDYASIILSKYFSEEILHKNIVDNIISPGCYRSLSLFDSCISYQCIAVVTKGSLGWSFSEKVLVTQETQVILIPIGCRVLYPSDDDPCELIEPPEALKRCKKLMTWRLCQQVWLPKNIQRAPGFYVFRGYAKCGRKTFLKTLAKELKVLCIVFRATQVYNLLAKDPDRAQWNLFFDKWKSLEPCIIIIEDCDWLWEDSMTMINSFIEGFQRLSKENRSIAIVANCSSSKLLPNSILSLCGMIVTFPIASQTARHQVLSLMMNNDSIDWPLQEILEASYGLTVGELKDSLAAVVDSSDVNLNWLKTFWQRKREWRLDNLTLLGIRVLFPNQLNDEASLSCHLYGLDSIIRQLEISLFPPSRYSSNILANMRGILFYGPPGTGKTSLAKRIAFSAHATFISVDVSNLIDAYVGESERLLRMLFQQAKEMAPCVVFFDEIDSLFNRRQRSPDMPLMRWRSSFILEMDDFKLDEQVYIVAATNRPWDLDQSLLQEGRLSKHFYIPLPDRQVRTQILMHHFRHMWPNALSEETTLYPFAHSIAEVTENFSGADLEGLIRSAVLMSCRKRMHDVEHLLSKEDIWEALSFYQASITLEQLQRYEYWQQSTH